MRRVVVTGYGAVTPLGCGAEAFFSGLAEGTSGIRTIRTFDAGSFESRIAGEVPDFSFAHPRLGEYLPEAIARDPKLAFCVVAAHEALVDALQDQPASRFYAGERVATVLAGGLELFHAEDIVKHLHGKKIDGRALFEELMDRPLSSFLQIPADLGLCAVRKMSGALGRSALNVSACAAGTQSIGEAFRLIRENAADMVITGGYDSMINPIALGGFCMLKALSTRNDTPLSASRPFDRTRDGFVLGEGAAVLVLEERDAALRRNAQIHAEIIGYATTMDAFRITDPSEDHLGAIRAMRNALSDAGVKPEEVDYINAHGTGTRKNDPAETAAIQAVFGDHAAHIPVSSTKSQTGHLIGAAGSVEFLAGLFALRRQIVPATINLSSPDDDCALCHVPRKPRSARVRVFVSNSFGFGGQNAVIVARLPE